MWQKVKLVIQVAALILAGITPGSVAAAQSAPAASLESQLRAQYILVKTGTDAYGLAIVEPGTVLVLQKGILGVPPNSLVTCSSKYQEGNLNGPNPLCQAIVAKDARYLQVGERVYPWKLEVNLAKDKITFGVVECDACNGATQPMSFKGEVVFQFAKGSLATADPAKVLETVSQVLAVDTSNQAPPAPEAQAQPAQPAAPPAEPQTIELGQTQEQVEAALGKPEKIVKLASKQIWVYKDLKVTFLKGKVTDVQ